MKTRTKVYKPVDKKIFSKTAKKTRVENIPGKIISRGGIRL